MEKVRFTEWAFERAARDTVSKMLLRPFTTEDAKNVTRLCVEGLFEPLSLRDAARLPNLTELVVRRAKLCDLEKMQTPYLSRLLLENCSFEKNCGCFPERLQLQKLELNDCDVSDFTSIASLLGLRELKVRDKSLQSLDGFSALSKLETLCIKDSEKLTGGADCAAAAGLTALTSLELELLPNLASLEFLRYLPNLTRLSISGCHAITDFSPIGALTELGELNIIDCSGFETIAPLAPLKKLTGLGILGCRKLCDVSALPMLSELRRLDLEQCDCIEDLSPLALLQKLTVLDVEDCCSAVLPAVFDFPDLCEIDIENCGGYYVQLHEDMLPEMFQKSEPLAMTLRLHLPSLTHMKLENCPEVADISPDSLLPELLHLRLYDLPIRSLAFLQSAADSLHTLQIRKTGIEDIAILAQMHVLQDLELRGNERLLDLRPVNQIEKLESYWGDQMTRKEESGTIPFFGFRT